MGIRKFRIGASLAGLSSALILGKKATFRLNATQVTSCSALRSLIRLRVTAAITTSGRTDGRKSFAFFEAAEKLK